MKRRNFVPAVVGIALLGVYNNHVAQISILDGGEWVKKHFRQLKFGNIFRFDEPDSLHYGNEYVVVSHSIILDEDGRPCVRTIKLVRGKIPRGRQL